MSNRVNSPIRPPVWWLALAVVCAFAVVRIRATHGVFSPTADEPVHIAAGYEYLTQHKYTIDSEHPPLARAVLALPLTSTHVAAFDAYAHGGDARQLHLADALLGANGNAMRDIARARAGNLVFVLIAIVAVALLARELFGSACGIAAAIAFVLAPPVLAHGGLATTDMAGTAAVALALFVLYRWLGTRTWPWTIALGVAIGFGALCKFTFLLFFGVCAVIAVVAWKLVGRAGEPKHFWRILAALPIAFVLVWGGYFFHHSRMVWMDPTAPAQTEHILGSRWIGERVNLPAPQYLFGLLRVKQHDERGTPVFLLGHVWPRGRWDYFPIVLGVKTPIPLLLLCAIGIATLRSHREIAVMALALLLVVMPSHINLGVRHILPEYLFIAILAGVAAGFSPPGNDRRAKARLYISLSLFLWLGADALLAHPDYLPWMNAFAGSHPEHVVVESNLDWGQDLHRLAVVCREQHITSLRAALFTSTNPRLVGVPITGNVDPFEPSQGWIAVSESVIEPEQAADPNRYAWLTNGRPFTRIGKSVRLYRVE